MNNENIGILAIFSDINLMSNMKFRQNGYVLFK